MDYILIGIAVILMAASFGLNKVFQQEKGTSIRIGMEYNFYLGVFTTIVFLFINKFKPEYSTYSLIMASAQAVFNMAYTIIGFKILKRNSITVYMLFLMSGGMLLPYIWGVLFLNESLTLMRVIGIVLMMSAIITANLSSEKIPMSTVLMGIAVFVLNGFVSITSKLHQIEPNFSHVSSEGFVIYSSVFKIVACGIFLLLMKKETKEKPIYSSPKILTIIFLASAISGISYLLQLIGAKSLPATVLYPLITGGGIIFSSVIDRIFFGVKYTPRSIAAVVLSFIGTCMFL